MLSRLNCLQNALVKYILPIRYPLGNVTLETIKIILCYNVFDFQKWEKKNLHWSHLLMHFSTLNILILLQLNENILKVCLLRLNLLKCLQGIRMSKVRHQGMVMSLTDGLRRCWGPEIGPTVSPQSVMCVCLCVRALRRVQLFATPLMIAHQAPLSMEFFRQEYWSGLPFPPPGDLPKAGIEPESPAFLAWAGRSFTTAPLGNLSLNTDREAPVTMDEKKEEEAVFYL